MIKKYQHKTMPQWPSLCAINSIFLNLVCMVVAFSVTTTHCHHAPCLEKYWLNHTHNSCTECTKCDEQQLIVLIPCQPHKDAICGTLGDLGYQWDWLAPQTNTAVEANWKERRKEIKISSKKHIDAMWDWQVISFAFAAIACLIFFVAAAYILYEHAKQWRHMEKMEKRFDKGSTNLKFYLINIL